MEVNKKCIICSNHYYENLSSVGSNDHSSKSNRKIDLNMLKTFYGLLLQTSSNQVLSSLSVDNSWMSVPEFSYFCITCQRKVVSVVDFSSDITAIKSKIQWFIVQIKIRILKSMSNSSSETRNICKIISRESATSFTFIPLSDKVDCFRSLAIIDYNPDVILRNREEHSKLLCKDVFNADKRFRSFWKKTSCYTSSKYLKEISENEIIRIKGIPRELLTLTEDEMKKYFTCVEKKYECQKCGRIIKHKRDAIKHVVSVHKKVIRFKCNYCKYGYYGITSCIRHIMQQHKKMRHTICTNRKKQKNFVKCINCNMDCVRTDKHERQSNDILASYSEIIGVNYRHPYFNWSPSTSGNSLVDIPLFCDSCYRSVVTLCDLNAKRKHMLRSVKKVVYQMKASILVSMSQEMRKINVAKIACSPDDFNFKEVTDKIDYVRSAVIQEFNPEIRLFQVDPQALPRNNRLSERNQKRAQKNSMYFLLKKDECIKLSPGLIEPKISLTEEETAFYLEYDGDDGKYKCRECCKILWTKSGAESHVNKFHKQLKLYECKYCGEQFFLKSECGYHVLSSHKDVRRFDESIAAPLPKSKLTTPDGIIDMGINAAPIFKSQDIRKLENGKHQCTICNAVHKNRCSIKRHQKKIHYGMTRYQCEFCGFKRLTRCDIVYHIQCVHAEEVKRLNIVYDTASQRASKLFDRQLRRKIVKTPANMDGINLLENIRTTADVEEYFTVAGLGFTCNYCGILLTIRLKMVQHVERQHLGIRTCECAICKKRFYSIQTCRVHIRRYHKQNQNLPTLNSGDKININTPIDAVAADNAFKTELSNFSNTQEDSHPEDSRIEAEVKQNPIAANDDFDGLFIIGNVNATSNDYLKIEVSSPSYPNWEHESEEYNVWENENSGSISMTSLETKQNYFPDRNNESNAFSEYDNLTIEQDQKEVLSESWNSSPHSLIRKDEQQFPNESMTSGNEEITNPLLTDKTAGVYALLNEGDIIIFPEVDSSEIFKYFKKLGKKKYECLKCRKILDTEGRCRRHVQVLHNFVKRYQCSICLKLFSSKFKCAEHFVVKHTGHKIYQCSICGNTHNTKASLQNHIKSHLNREFSCSICQLKFATEQRLRTHDKNVHKPILPN